MNTLNLNFRDENESKKILFQYLFLLEIELKKYDEETVIFHDEIKDVVESIDQLLKALMDDYFLES